MKKISTWHTLEGLPTQEKKLAKKPLQKISIKLQVFQTK